MGYNDLIIIILLLVLIITIFLKNDKQYLMDNTQKSIKELQGKPINNKIIKNIDKSKKTIAKYIYNKNNKNLIIDKYSEFDNIKSLNSMDNTLSDIVSVVDINNAFN